MFNHEIFAVTFGRTVDLLRRGAPRAEQKAALHAVYALTSVASAMLRVYEGVLTVDDVGIPDSLEFIPGLIERMQVHGVAEIAIAKDAEPLELLAAAGALAGEPDADGGAMHLKRRLRHVRSTRVMVIPASPARGPVRRGASVTQAFEAEGLEGEDAGRGPGVAARAPRMSAEEFQMIELPADAGSGSAVAPAGTPLDAALAQVAADPFGPDILERLSALGKQVERAIAAGEIDAAVHVLSAVVGWEAQLPEGSERRAYGIMLRRALTRDAVLRLAERLGDAQLVPELVQVLKRSDDVVEILLDKLTLAETIRERKACMTVLRNIPDGFAGVVHMLQDGRWFVVRNVAELMGEHRIAAAVPDLDRCLGHRDPRVRRAAAIALARIGTPATVEPLRRLLKSGDPELRPLVAASIGGASARSLAMPLVALAEQEEDPARIREYYLALGRIGTPDAVSALVKASKPGGRLLGRVPAALRAAAVEGLKVAGGRGAAALEALVDDGDKVVRDAARAALEAVRARSEEAGRERDDPAGEDPLRP
jgi:HEAT repeat protein